MFLTPKDLIDYSIDPAYSYRRIDQDTSYLIQNYYPWVVRVTRYGTDVVILLRYRDVRSRVIKKNA